MTGHSIEWKFDRDYVHAQVVCKEDDLANCRLSGDCDCESWSILRDPDGTPFHLYLTEDEKGDEVEVRHEMRPMGDCNIRLFLDDEIQEMNQDGETKVLATTPIKAEFDGDVYTWSFA